MYEEGQVVARGCKRKGCQTTHSLGEGKQ